LSTALIPIRAHPHQNAYRDYGDYSALHNSFVHIQRVLQHKIWQSPVSCEAHVNMWLVTFLAKFTGKSSSPHQLSFKIASGPLGKNPKTRVHGATPLVSFIVSRRHHIVMGMYLCHCLGRSIANLEIMRFTLPTPRSVKPVEDG